MTNTDTAAQLTSLAKQLTATGIQIHDRDSGKDYGLHDDCLPAMDSALAEQGATDAFHPFKGQLVVIGPMFSTGWECVFCRKEVAA
jgi:hypothetical protein